MEKVKIDKQFSLKVWDFLKGIYMAVIVPLLVTVLEVIQAGSFDLDWESLARIAVSSIAAYLLKNFLSPTKVVVEQPSQLTVLSAERDPEKPPILYPPGTPIHPSPGPTVPPNPKP